MNNWKTNLINAYRLTTAPYRAWQRASLIRAGRLPVYVLFYHRVSDGFPTPWTISCQEFEAHINWLENEFEFVSLQAAQEIVSSGENRRPRLAITFDDGYAENMEFALPLLLERRIPTTYFVTWGNVVEQRPFGHDLALGQPLAVNSVDSIRAIANAGIEIGAHSRTHLDLGEINDPDVIFDEVITAGRELSQAISSPIRYFAFPFGQAANLNATAIQYLQTEGYAGCCTAFGGSNAIGGDPFQINRIHGDPSLARIKNWLSFDPRLESASRSTPGAKVRLPGLDTADSWNNSLPSTELGSIPP
jgi:peptidoglycan/xylan/chitin deacetylase (PgdA/CDA1 family)